MAGEMTVKQVLILTLGAALAVAGTATAGERGGPRGGGGHPGGGYQGCGGGCGGGGHPGGGGNYGRNVNVNVSNHVNASSHAYASSSASAFSSARSFSSASAVGRYGGGGTSYRGVGGYYGNGINTYAGDYGPAYAVGVPVQFAGGGVTAIGWNRAPVSAPFGYEVRGFGRDYHGRNRSVTRYEAPVREEYYEERYEAPVREERYQERYVQHHAPVIERRVERQVQYRAPVVEQRYEHHQDRGGRYGYSEQRFYEQGHEAAPVHAYGPAANIHYEAARPQPRPHPIVVRGAPVRVSQAPVYIDSPPV
ncbi:MAG: hypothetical protein DCE92_13060 [Alphaproteobacteria bacterium]|nr:MAG: hypothetical protein DCE92_13060 [Alphaproteobacteria bacterium]